MACDLGGSGPLLTPLLSAAIRSFVAWMWPDVAWMWPQQSPPTASRSSCGQRRRTGRLGAAQYLFTEVARPEQA